MAILFVDSEKLGTLVSLGGYANSFLGGGPSVLAGKLGTHINREGLVSTGCPSSRCSRTPSALKPFLTSSLKPPLRLQVAARKRCQLSDGEGGIESLAELDGAAGYARMRALCVQLGSEVRLDIEIHKQNIFPR